MGEERGPRPGTVRHPDARPWTVKLYVLLVAASQPLLLLPEFQFEAEWSSFFHLVLLLGVWIGSRIAWALTLGLYSMSFVIGLVWSTGAGWILVGLLAIWIGLLLAGPTQRWVGRASVIRSLVGTLPSEWRSRPMTLRMYVGASLAVTLLAVARDPGQLAYPWILLTVVSLLLLKMLWDGSAGVWWLSVIVHGGYAALSLSAAFRDPAMWTDFAISAVALTLLVHRSTRAWFNERIAARFPVAR